MSRNQQHGQGQVELVTGRRRFFELLRTPFNLRLMDTPGNCNLKDIVIDGSNVAMNHGLNIIFSCRGIALTVQQFWDRGHRTIRCYVPQHRMKNNSNITEPEYLTELKKLGIVVLTPSRQVHGRTLCSDDDVMMLDFASTGDGVIVTNDQMRDHLNRYRTWDDIIENRLLPYLFAGNSFQLPRDPLGRRGPSLDEFLSRIPRPQSFNRPRWSGRRHWRRSGGLGSTRNRADLNQGRPHPKRRRGKRRRR